MRLVYISDTEANFQIGLRAPIKQHIALQRSDLESSELHFSSPKEYVLDVSGLYVLPGFVDTHIHGLGGYRFYGHDCEALALEHLKMVAGMLPRSGTTKFLITTMTEANEQLEIIAKAFRNAKKLIAFGDWQGAIPLGLHLEGPFLNTNKRGAHSEKHCKIATRQTVDELDAILGADIRILTASPEVDDNGHLLNWSSLRGFSMSMGHTEISGAKLTDDKLAGYERVTHLFNAMNELHHRSDPLAIGALSDPSKYLELILDGKLVSVQWLAHAIEVAGPDRVVGVSDCIHLSQQESCLLGNFESVSLKLDDGVWKRSSDGAVWVPHSHFEKSIETLRNDLRLEWHKIAKLLSITPSISIGEAPNHLSNDTPLDATFVRHDGTVIITFVDGQLSYLAERERLTNVVNR